MAKFRFLLGNLTRYAYKRQWPALKRSFIPVLLFLFSFCVLFVYFISDKDLDVRWVVPYSNDMFSLLTKELQERVKTISTGLLVSAQNNSWCEEEPEGRWVRRFMRTLFQSHLLDKICWGHQDRAGPSYQIFYCGNKHSKIQDETHLAWLLLLAETHNAIEDVANSGS